MIKTSRLDLLKKVEQLLDMATKVKTKGSNVPEKGKRGGLNYSLRTKRISVKRNLINVEKKKTKMACSAGEISKKKESVFKRGQEIRERRGIVKCRM